jgi:alkaline phosphatase D
VYNDPDYNPWCYTQVDSDGNGVVGVWGYCAPPGTVIPTGQVGTVADDVAAQTTRNRHIIDLAESNYGKIDIDWENELVTLSIQNHYEEVVSTIIPFQQSRMKL